jgi:hypothetical protein
MIKKSLKYLTIASVNLIVLTILLALWTDDLELTFNDLVRPAEFLIILGVTALSLLSMRLLVNYFRQKKIYSIKSKVKIATALTLLISSYLYFTYSQKVYQNFLINGKFRKQISEKIMSADMLPNGTKADNLTSSEYNFITDMCWFPTLPKEATHVSYNYRYDGFLPDYSFILTYDMPLGIKVDTMNYSKGDFEKSQTVKIIGDSQRVTYSESER